MSVESDFRATLAGFAPLTALVGTRISQNSVREGAPLPYVVFSTVHSPTRNVLGDVLVDLVSINCACWSRSALEADAVAAQVEAALATASPMAGATVVAREGGHDGDLGLDATVLTVEWWD